MADEADDGDFYALLNLSKDASPDEIKAAFRNMSLFMHPDKHHNPERKKQAEEVFPKIKKAYEVLSNPQLRILYDLYGADGLEAGSEIAPYFETRAEIKAEFEARHRYREQQVQRALADPKGTMEVSIDARCFFDPGEEEGFGELDVTEMNLRQEVAAELSSKDTVSLEGILMTERGWGGGSCIASLQHAHDKTLGSKYEVWLGDQTKQFAAGLSKQWASGLFTYGRLAIYQDGSIGMTTTLMQPLTVSSVGFLKWGLSPHGTFMMTQVVYETEHLHVQGAVQFGIPDSHLAAGTVVQLSDDVKLKCKAKVGTLGASLSFGAERTVIDESDRLAAQVTMDASGTTLEFKVHRFAQNYRVPILLSDVVSPEIVLVGAAVPLIAYFAIKRLIIDPYIERADQVERKDLRKRNRRVIEQRRREAQTVLDLMAAKMQRIVAAEEASRNGLVIVQALYGQLIIADSDVDDDDPLVTDVTVAVQCMVENHKLQLTAATKADLQGFYDPCPGEPKSLRIRYKCAGKLFECTVPDDAPVDIPQRKHRILSMD